MDLFAKDSQKFDPLKHAASLNFTPGVKLEYFIPAFNGLALIIEKMTGRKWQDFILDKIFEPAGMKSSRITDGPYPENSVAHAYVEHNQVFEGND